MGKQKEYVERKAERLVRRVQGLNQAIDSFITSPLILPCLSPPPPLFFLTLLRNHFTGLTSLRWYDSVHITNETTLNLMNFTNLKDLSLPECHRWNAINMLAPSIVNLFLSGMFTKKRKGQRRDKREKKEGKGVYELHKFKRSVTP